jgi:two-component system chemotaxis sensor kinase CheA
VPDAERDESRFSDTFLDDYFAECDEHLRAIRGALLKLEAALRDGRLDPGALEQVFRGCHSIKGLSGMVELAEAETLAHELESYLRALRDGELGLTPAGVDTLVDGVMELERVIVARRDRGPVPPVDALIARVRALGAGGAAPPAGVPAAAVVAPSGQRWQATYVPTPALLERGVNVNTVRERLQETGTIVSAAPDVREGGRLAFTFVMETSGEPARAEWERDGVVWTRLGEVETAAAPVEPVPPAVTTAAHFVRVDLARLDDLMRIIGDLVIDRARLAESLARVERHVPAGEWQAVNEHRVSLERRVRDLRQGVMRVRLIPVGDVFDRMVFVVRDLAREYGKQVHLELHGKATEIDKFLIERMMEPVLHLVRNAIAHGLEAPEARQRAGKSREGTITLRASTVGDTALIDVEDDGQGIDVAAVTARARAAGVLLPEGPLDAAALLELICAPGLSTRATPDRGSGRGVGMAAVRAAVQEVGGTLTLETDAGRGTRFTLQLPVTLAITDAIIATVGNRTFAVPQTSVSEVIEVEPSAVRQLENNEIIPYRQGTLPLLRLSRIFGVPETPRPRLHVFVTGRGAAAVGVAVDRIVGQKEIVVRTFGDRFIKVHGVAGATELGDGRVVLILDIGALVRDGEPRGVR